MIVWTEVKVKKECYTFTEKGQTKIIDLNFTIKHKNIVNRWNPEVNFKVAIAVIN